MLDELHVQNIALIKDASFELSQGLTVLTGETGAGKTALLSALRLIAGQRGDAKAVRDGCDEASVEARFIDGDDEVIVSRRISAQGRSRCSIDGHMAAVSELSQAASCIHIHNQHDQIQLLQAQKQLDYLDKWIDVNLAHLQPYQQARHAYLEANAHYEQLLNQKQNQQQKIEFSRFALQEIEKINPLPGEYEELEAQLPRLRHAADLALSAREALSALYDEGASLDWINTAAQHLANERGVDAELDDMAKRLDEIQIELEDFVRDLSSYAQSMDFDPEELENALNRLGELDGLCKRFGPTMEQVFALKEESESIIAAAQASPQVIEDALQARNAALDELEKQAQLLENVRKEQALVFCNALQDSLKALAMADASFEFSFQELPLEKWSELGSSKIELLYRPAPQAKARPLSAIASGGELSRILLAVECLYSQRADEDNKETYVFDEIDQGVGGATGAAVAERLKELSKKNQVVVVTHLPQVAACADKHYVVSKSDASEGLPETQIHEIAGEERVEEIARMMAGSLDQDALRHARRLIKDALDD